MVFLYYTLVDKIMFKNILLSVNTICCVVLKYYERNNYFSFHSPFPLGSGLSVLQIYVDRKKDR